MLRTSLFLHSLWNRVTGNAHIEQSTIDVTDEIDHRLHFIEKVVYLDHAVKIARRADQIELLIYPPGALLATRLIADHISNYENALEGAKAIIRRSGFTGGWKLYEGR